MGGSWWFGGAMAVGWEVGASGWWGTEVITELELEMLRREFEVQLLRQGQGDSAVQGNGGLGDEGVARGRIIERRSGFCSAAVVLSQNIY